VNIKIRVRQIIGPAAAGSVGPAPTPLEDRTFAQRIGSAKVKSESEVAQCVGLLMSLYFS